MRRQDRGALPRLRGRGEQGDVAVRAIRFGEDLDSGQRYNHAGSESRHRLDRRRQSLARQKYCTMISPAHHGLASEAALHGYRSQHSASLICMLRGRTLVILSKKNKSLSVFPRTF